MKTVSIDDVLRLRSEQLREESAKLRAVANELIAAARNARAQAGRARAAAACLPGRDRITAPATILLVDDEPMVRTFLSSVLGRRGHSILAADGGADGLRWFAEHRTIDLILADVSMPDMSGPEMVRLMRRERPQVKVLYISGHATLLSRSAEEESYGLLAKPFTASTLVTRVESCLLT